jgi:hypothetical protein
MNDSIRIVTLTKVKDLDLETENRIKSRLNQRKRLGGKRLKRRVMIPTSEANETWSVIGWLRNFYLPVKNMTGWMNESKPRFEPPKQEFIGMTVPLILTKITNRRAHP